MFMTMTSLGNGEVINMSLTMAGSSALVGDNGEENDSGKIRTPRAGAVRGRFGGISRIVIGSRSDRTFLDRKIAMMS